MSGVLCEGYYYRYSCVLCDRFVLRMAERVVRCVMMSQQQRWLILNGSYREIGLFRHADRHTSTSHVGDRCVRVTYNWTGMPC
jgi:hypothetical protein